MPELATQPITGTWKAAAMPSTFAFKVRHSGTFWFRGVMPDVEATLREVDDGLVLEGAAKVESISVVEPAEMRAHLLAADFFDASNHPTVDFRSTDLRLYGDGRLELDGELTIAGTTRPITALGEWSGPAQAAWGQVFGLHLHADLDRREFGFDWNAATPDGREVLGWEVALEIDAMLMPEAPRA